MKNFNNGGLVKLEQEKVIFSDLLRFRHLVCTAALQGGNYLFYFGTEMGEILFQEPHSGRTIFRSPSPLFLPSRGKCD